MSGDLSPTPAAAFAALAIGTGSDQFLHLRQVHLCGQVGEARRLVRNRHGLDKVLLEQRLDSGLDLDGDGTAEPVQVLADHKISRGLTAVVATTEQIYLNYDGTRPDGGTDNQTRIRNFIIDAYSSWSTEFVLLGGDADREEPPAP